jgi:transcriptional regulator with XRE-family HTH domain
MGQNDTVVPVSLQQVRLFATGFPVTDNSRMTLGNRIKQARERLGMSQVALAEAAGMRQQSLSALESGKSASTTKMLALAEALRVSVPWLERGETSFSIPAGHVPEATDAKATRLAIAEENRHSLDEWLLTQGIRPGTLFVWEQRGAAMEPTIYDGDSLAVELCDPHADIVDGGVYLIGREVEPTKVVQRFRRLRETAGGDLVIISDNPDKLRFPDEIVPVDKRSEFMVLAKAEFRAGRIR